LPARRIDVESAAPSHHRLDAAAFASIASHVVSSNRIAMAEVIDSARRIGLDGQQHPTPLHGEAAAMGDQIARALETAQPDQVLVWGGETTVTLQGANGTGGRSQELALSAAQHLHRSGTRAVLLAAGTDGRDGPTDAAGAIVDRFTWDRIRAAGRDPGQDLLRHDAYPALDAAGALLRTGQSGTNVMDLVMAIIATPPAIPS
jgi:glycerate 2-kinase